MRRALRKRKKKRSNSFGKKEGMGWGGGGGGRCRLCDAHVPQRLLRTWYFDERHLEDSHWCTERCNTGFRWINELGIRCSWLFPLFGQS